MDKNLIWGGSLILLIIGVFTYMNQPTAEQIAQQRKYQDSIKIEQAKLLVAEEAKKSIEIQNVANQATDTTSLEQKYGQFAQAVVGETKFSTLENKLVKIVLSNRGGRVYSVELKEYKSFDGKPLILFQGDQNKFGFTFTNDNRVYNTNDLYFTESSSDSKSKTYTLNAGEGSSLAYKYVLPENSYMVEFSLVSNNLNKSMNFNRGFV